MTSIRNLFFSASVALLFTGGLFMSMSYLLHPTQNSDVKKLQKVRLNFVDRKETDIKKEEIEEKIKPEQKPPPKPDTPVPVNIKQIVQEQPNISSLPALEALSARFEGMKLPIQSMPVQKEGGGGVTLTRAAQVIHQIKPVYPARLLKRKISGVVVVEFYINRKGKAYNVKVISAKPEKLFNKSVIQAVLRSKYQPVLEGGLFIEELVAQPFKFGVID